MSEHSLRALYDLYCWRELARAQRFKKNKHGACRAIILFCPVKIVQVLFSVFTIKRFRMCEKRLFFNLLKVILSNTLFSGRVAMATVLIPVKRNKL